MKNIIFVLVITLLSACSGKIEKEKEFLITENSVGYAKIGMKMQELKEIYQDCKFIEEDVWLYGVDGGGNGLRLTKNGEDLFFVWTLQEKDEIQSIVALNSKYKTKEGCYAGMTSGELKKKLPGIKAHLNLMLESEYATIPKSGISYAFLDSTQTLGTPENIGEDYDITNPSAKVTWVTVFNKD